MTILSHIRQHLPALRLFTFIVCLITISQFLAGGCGGSGSSGLTASVIATDATASEAGDTGRFRIFLNKPNLADVTVTYTVSGTAGAGDYTPLSGTLVIPAFDTFATITLTALDDNQEEIDETVVITLVKGTQYGVKSTTDTAVVIIGANDTPVATIAASDASATEAGDPGEFTVTLSTSPMNPKVISFTPSGTATLASDYQIPATVVITAPATTGTVAVTPLQDVLPAEGDETVILTLATGVGYTVGGADSDTVTIADDDTVEVTIAATTPGAYENDVTPGAFTITAAVAPTADMPVTFTVGGDATEGSDYQAIGTSATILAGQTSVDVTVTPIDDADAESPETVIATLAAGAGYTIGAGSTDTITIHDNEIVNIVDLNMVLQPISSGSFTMGSPGTEPYRYADEGPQHTVTISNDYWIGATEVTQEQYLAIIGSNPSADQTSVTQPVDTVSWHEAMAFCDALNAREVARIPAGYQFRLPTEAEWEYACRAGTTTAFSHGNDTSGDGITYTDLGTYAWYLNNSGGVTQQVAQKTANAWGLYDMHGNIWEWCYDFYAADTYTASSETDPIGPITGTTRVRRGGSWGSGGTDCRSANRNGVDPNGKGGDLSFRIVLAPIPDVHIADLAIVMKAIPRGTFTMGSHPSDPQVYVGEQPQHSVTLTKNFWMAETELTQSQYSTIMGSNPSGFSGALLPVEQVDWNDAVAFCDALTIREAANIPSGYEYRLATEAEWEYACRAGTTTIFSYGDDVTVNNGATYANLENYAWNIGNSGDVTHLVRQKLPNPWGLYDMHGNVSEWCYDWHGSYNIADQVDPTGPPSGTSRVTRGGDGYGFAESCRSAYRWPASVTATSSFIGFRIVLAPVLP